ncbi:YgjV family protein [Photobacterium ganghwense]|uniref:YgjV family protein n=1 Tax=Photobacterium ganghwense TaxID=320778 RepID=UPI001C2D4768|nr:YgjV family protein [Photobacterium ganghwense]MBV1842618.1 YgjV family protein [Photobacterium ganghwense]
MTVDISFAQALGFVSFALGISTFYQKDDRKLKIVMLIFNLNHLVHFLLLGSLVSALSALLSALRTATAIYVSSIKVAALFISISLISGFWLADNLWDLWPILGTVIGTYSVFMLKGIAMRLGFLAGATCWLINNLSIGSIGGSLLEMTVISVNIITIYRLNRDRQQQPALNN